VYLLDAPADTTKAKPPAGCPADGLALVLVS
jgi:hypothetical protein